MRVIVISTNPIAMRNRSLATTSHTERKNSFAPTFSTLIGFCLDSVVEDAVGLVTLLAMLIQIHSF